MRVLLSVYGSRGDVQPMAALAVALRDLGAEVRACVPPDEDFVELFARVGVPAVPTGVPIRTTEPPSSPSDLPRRAAEFVAAQFDTVAGEAAGCDALVASGLAHFASRSVGEKLGIRYVYATVCPVVLPSPNQRPFPLPGRPFPPHVTDNRVLWQLNAQSYNAVFGPALNPQRASVGLPPVNDVLDHMFTDHPWLATDPTLDSWREPTGIDVVQTGAWILPDERPLPAELMAFLDAGPPPVYVGFGSMPVPENTGRAAIEAIRALGHRAVVERGWADLDVIDDRDDCLAVGAVNQQALFGRVAAAVHHGGAGTTDAAARAGAPQVVLPQIVDQPYWASRVAKLGIGAAHHGRIPTTESLSDALRTALAPETRSRATAVASAIRTDGAAVAARLLLD
ncbi:MAG TPA: glycosyltransferase [Solirubrobacteraceae bacterium]